MKFLKVILLFCIFFVSLHAKELEKVSIQFLWIHQFQFAGYYMAKEKGFYEEIGLDVEMREYSNTISPTKEVLSRRATYGIGRSSLLVDSDKEAEIAFLYATFQSSPLIILARKDSGIKTVKDMSGKRMMNTPDIILTASLYAMGNRFHIHQNDLIQLEHTFNVDDLLDGKTDLMSAYLSSEPYLMQEKGVEPIIFDPKDYGFNFYADILFTSKEELNTNQQRTKAFSDASLKGWEYAFNHIDETVELILKKYNGQNKSKAALLYEANVLKELAYYKLGEKGLGNIDIEKIQRIHDIYNVMGLVENALDLNAFTSQVKDKKEIDFSFEERKYLDTKKEISMCILPDILPLSKIDSTGEYIGITADYLNLIAQKLEVKFNLVEMKKEKETLEYLKEKKCEFIPIILESKTNESSLAFSKAYLDIPWAIATTLDKPFTVDIDTLNDKTFVLLNNSPHKHIIKKKHKLKNILEVDSYVEAKELVLDGKAYGIIGNLISLAYEIEKDHSILLKVSAIIGDNEHGVLAVDKSNIVLLGILNKAIDEITDEEKNIFYNKWVSVKYDEKIDYTLVYQVLVVFSFIIFIILYFLSREKKLNISLTRKFEKAVAEVKQRTHLAEEYMEIAEVIMMTLNTKHEVTMINKYGADLLEYPKEEIVGKNFMENFIPKKYIEEIADVGKNVIEEKKFHKTYENPIVTKGGHERVIIWNNTKLYDSDGNIIGILTSGTDVTDIRHKEEQFFAQSRLAQMGEMISMIAHQWRQPLGAISATTINLETKLALEVFDLDTKEGQASQSKYFIKRLEHIGGYVESLTQTIDDFRNFYKPNKEVIESTFKEIVNKSMNIVGTSLFNDGIHCEYDFSSNPKIEMYDSEMMQVVLNILKNAQDNFNERKTIKPIIHISVKNKVLYIEDNGGGISSSIVKSVFDPYFSTKEDKNGTGLGLYMSKIIVEEHHEGKLLLKNIDGGVSFSIDLSENA